MPQNCRMGGCGVQRLILSRHVTRFRPITLCDDNRWRFIMSCLIEILAEAPSCRTQRSQVLFTRHWRHNKSDCEARWGGRVERELTAAVSTTARSTPSCLYGFSSSSSRLHLPWAHRPWPRPPRLSEVKTINRQRNSSVYVSTCVFVLQTPRTSASLPISSLRHSLCFPHPWTGVYNLPSVNRHARRQGFLGVLRDDWLCINRMTSSLARKKSFG